MAKNSKTKKNWWQTNLKFLISTGATVILALITYVVGPSVVEFIKSQNKPDLTEGQQPTAITSTSIAPVKVYGPITQELKLRADEVRTWSAGQNLLNFKVDVRFMNPYDATDHDWDYGFSFRRTAQNDAYRIYVTSQKKWFVELSRFINGKQTIEPIANGDVENLNIAADQFNDLSLIVTGESAEFLLNNSSIATFGVGKKMISGDILIGTGYTGHNWDDKTITFEQFTIFEYK